MGLQMDNEFASALAPLIPTLQNLPKPKIHDVETRRQILAGFTTNTQLPDGVTQTIHNVKTPDGYSLPIWHLKKTDQNPSAEGGPAVLHIHGGGFISLSPAAMMAGLAEYVLKTDVQLFAVDYRLAPEFPYPTPLNDCWDALTWIMSQAEEFGVDATRVGLMGESAGGGLAAGLTLLARDRQLQPPIARQILGYPMLDDRNSESVPEGVVTLWNEEDNVTGWTAYLGSKVQSDDVPINAAPARAKDVKGLPPLYMDIGQLDLFVKENLAYAGKFLDAMVETEFHIYPGLSHGFEGLAPNHPVAKEMKEKRVQQLRKL